MYETLKDLSLGSVTRLLSFFYSLPVVGGSFGVAIILLTLTVMVVLMPLTLKATKSTITMTQMQPKLRELQKKHKDDKQALNAEMMAMYQAEGVNPVGGCLPMVAQLPVFLVLFNVLRGLAQRISDKAYFAVANHAHGLAGRPTTTGETFDPSYVDPDTEMYADLTDGRTSMDFGPFDLAESAWEVFQSSFVTSIPYLILILFVVGTSYYQQRQISARRGSNNEPLTQQQQTQQQLLKVLPLMSGAWSFVFPAGLVLYWATSNTFRIGQQAYITRSLYSGDAPGAQMLKEQAARRDEEADGDGDGSDDDSSEPESKKSGDGEKKAASTNGKSQKSQSKSAGKSAGKSGAGSRPKAGAGSMSNGAEADGEKSGSTVGDLTDRERRWAERRAQKAKIQARRSASGSGSGADGDSAGSSRVTPKGTKPSSKKKRKR